MANIPKMAIPRNKVPVPARSVTATEAKNAFGRVLDLALRDGSVMITRHDTPRAVVLSWQQYQSLAGRKEPDLDALRSEFDALYADMQSPKAAKAMKAAFEATPEELGAAAVWGARRRKRKKRG